MPGPLGAYLTFDIQRFKAEAVFFHDRGTQSDHGFQGRPFPEANPINYEGNAEDTLTAGAGAIYGNQGAGTIMGSSANAQVTPPMAVPPVPMTPPLIPLVGRSEPPTQPARLGEAAANQPMESGHGSAKTVPANLVSTKTTTAVMAALPADDHVPIPDPPAGGSQQELPLPHAAGLIADVLPLDRASLELAVDQFFEQLEDLGVGQLVEQGPIRAIPLSLALIGTAAAVEVTRRRLRSGGGGRAARGRDPLRSDELRGFPELPGSWSTRLT
jgi:hypothetical protein